MKDYDIVAVLWQDHSEFSRTALPDNPEDLINPTLSVGILIKETEKVVVLIHDIEKYEDRDDVSYLVIFKPAILSLKKYGKIKLRKPRE